MTVSAWIGMIVGVAAVVIVLIYTFDKFLIAAQLWRKKKNH